MRNSFLRHSLFSLTILLSSFAHAQDPQLSCSGIQEKWLLSIDDLIGAFEYKLNEKLSEYVRIADFNVGDDQFGVMGHADLGYIDIPEFDPQDPKKFLESGVQDLAISPSYIIEAKVFGTQAEILSANMSAGQGCKTKILFGDCQLGNATEGQSGKDRIHFNVKVGGITVLADENAPPETEAPQALDQPLTPIEMANRLPASDKKGASGEFLNIRRSFGGSNQSLYRIPISDVFTVVIDAGYVLHAGIIFTYGVKSEGLFNIGGKAGYAMDKKSFAPQPQSEAGVSNPALDPQDFENCPMHSNSCVMEPSTPTWTKSKNFWATTAGPIQNASQKYLKAKDFIRDLRTKDAYRDARITRAIWGENLDKIKNDSNLSVDEKNLLMESINLPEVKRDMQKVQRLMDNVSYNSQVLLSTYNAIEETIQKISEEGVPEVTADAAVSLDGHASVWANATAEMNLYNLVRAWAGLEGGLTALDASMGLGASVSSRSEYLNLTGKLNYEVLKGTISLIWSYEILGVITGDGSAILFTFPGKTKTNDSMIARMDFDPPQGESIFFWCSDLFDDPSALDTERCRDGDVGLRKILPALAAHDEYKKFVLDESPISEQDSCVLSADGQVISTSTNSTSECNNLLPSTGGNLNNIPINNETVQHPILKSFEQNPRLFLTYLRDYNNRPLLNFAALTPTTKTPKTYVANQPVQITDTNGKLVPAEYPPASMGLTTDGIEARLFTITSSGYLYNIPSKDILSGNGASSNETVARITNEYATMIADATSATFQNDPRLQMNLGGINNGSNGTYSNSTTMFVGHLSSLPNQSLVHMAESYRLGECNISSGNGKRYLRIRSQPYPMEGMPDGDTFENAKYDRLGCDIALGQNATPSNQQVEMWEACQLRAALVTQKCFPPPRVTELIEIASLTPEQLFSYFSGPNKRITGKLGFGDAITEDLTNGVQDILAVNRTNNISPAGRLSSLNMTSSAPSGTHGHAVSNALATDLNILVNPTNGGTLKDIVSPNGNCSGYQKTNNGSKPFYDALLAPAPEIGRQLNKVWGTDIIGTFPVNVFGQTSTMTALVINKNGCLNHNNNSTSATLLDNLIYSDALNQYLDFGSGSWGPLSGYGRPTENRPHTVVLMCTQANQLNGVNQQYSPWGSISWKAFIRSAAIIKPYAIVGKNNAPYPLDPVEPYKIAETYNELPILQNGGYVFGPSICDESNDKNINNFPDGPAYAGDTKPKLLSGSLHQEEMKLAIGKCLSLGDCSYIPVSQKLTNPASCAVQAKMGSTTLQTFNANNPGKNLDQCLGSNLEFSSAQSFCQTHRQTLSSQITSQGITTIGLWARWEQLQDIGNDLQTNFQDPAAGPHNLGQCVFEKGATGPAVLLGAVNTKDPSSPESSSECLLTASANSHQATISTQSIGITPVPITADFCKAKLGYQTSAKSSALNDVQTSTTCGALTGTQLLQLRAAGVVLYTGTSVFNLNAVVSAPGQSNHGQSASVGICSIDQTTIENRINEQTQCTLRMKSGNGEYLAAPIHIYLPPSAQGVSRLAQCEDAKHRYVSSVGSTNVCPASLRRRPEYAAMMAATNNKPVTYEFFLGETSAAGAITCEGPAIKGNASAAEYNPNCVSDLTGTAARANNASLTLNPLLRMHAIDQNQWLSQASASLYPPATKCNRYWNAEMVEYQPDGTTSNHTYCQSLAGDVKAKLGVWDSTIPAPTQLDIMGNGTWTSKPKSGTIAVVTARSKVFAPPPNPPPGGPSPNKVSASGKKGTSGNKTSGSAKKTVAASGASTGGGGSANKEPDPPGGGGGSTLPPVWQTSNVITTCSYEFKNTKNNVWDLVASTWTTPTTPTDYNNSNVRVRKCTKDLQGKCVTLQPGDLAIFAGSGNRAIKTYSVSNMPSPLNQTFVDQFCSANYQNITPLADNLESDPDKRFPVWLKFADAQGLITPPGANEYTAYFCKPKNCELLIEFGSHSEFTESEWKNKLSAMPTSANACKTYYQGQVSSYCSQMLLLAQMPDNMEVTLKSVFDGQARTVGTCQAPSTQRTCFIGQRKPESWLSWLMGSQIQVVEEVKNHEKALVLPTSTSRTGLVIPNFYANTLAACVDSARELNFNHALCQRNVNGINHNQSYEIAVQFGEFTQTVNACPVAPGPVTEPPPVEVHLRTMGAQFEDPNICERNIALENYVSGSAIQVAACPTSSCDENELGVVYAGYPTSKNGIPILDVTEFMGNEQPVIRLKDILSSVWDGTNQGTGTIYISQSDHKGNRGNWIQLPSDTFAQSVQDMYKGCPDSSNIFNARLVGDVCEQTRIQLSGYSSQQTVEVGICKAAYCNQNKFVPVFNPQVITEENKNVLEFIPVLESTWSQIQGDGTIGLRQVNQEGVAGPWIAIPKTKYESAAQNAFAECGVNP